MAFTTGQQVTASDLNDISQLRGVRAVETSGTQSISNGAAQKVTFTTETFDPQTEFASSTFTAEAAGYYLVHASVMWLTSGNNISTSLAVYKNGSTYAAQSTVADTGQTFIEQSVSTLVSLAISDTIEIYASHSHSGAISLSYAAGPQHRLEIVRLFNG